MQAASNRTFICSVVFLDIVEYSRKPVAEQIRHKEQLNALLTEALANVAPNDRIILDTGDGAALSFLGDPEDAMFVSLSLRDALAAQAPGAGSLKLRIGVNLGPVKLVKDINGQPNIIGDGINVAERVMSFCDPGQVLVSRSYYEVVSCLSEDYSKLFHYEGARTDKHVREHEVYAVQGTGDLLQRAAASSPRARAETTGSSKVIEKLSQTTEFVTGNLRRRPRVATGLAVVAILVVSVGIRAGRQPAGLPVAPPAPQETVAMAIPAAPTKKKEAATPAPAQPPAAAQAKPATPAPKPTAPATAKPAPAPAKPAAKTAQTDTTTVRPPPSDWTSIFGFRQEREAPAETTAPADKPEPAPAAPTGTGTLIFTVSPWAEIYVDGVRRGEVPPTYELRLSAGSHRIELRNPEFPRHARTVVVKPGARIEVKYWFLPKEEPNPFDKLPWK